MLITHRRLVLAAGFGLILLLAGIAEAQRRLVTHREYYDAVYSAKAMTAYDRTRRVETTREELRNGVVVSSDTTILEVLIPSRERYYTKRTQDGKTIEYERITIDHWEYTRKDGGRWIKVDLRQQPGGTGSGSASGRATCSQYSVESVFLNGVPAKLYERIDHFNTDNELSFEETRAWMSEEGLPLRSEKIKGSVSPRVETWKEVIAYDYSPDLKIEAPIN